jgi:hypothetical protein
MLLGLYIMKWCSIHQPYVDRVWSKSLSGVGVLGRELLSTYAEQYKQQAHGSYTKEKIKFIQNQYNNITHI